MTAFVHKTQDGSNKAECTDEVESMSTPVWDIVNCPECLKLKPKKRKRKS